MTIEGLRPSASFVSMNGQTFQIWHGTGDRGQRVTVLVARVIVTDAFGSRRYVAPETTDNIIALPAR